MATRPPVVDDWETVDDWESVDDSGNDDAARQFGQQQMAQFGQTPKLGFAGLTNPKEEILGLERGVFGPQPGEPEFYGDPNDPESIKQAGMQRGTAEAAGPAAMVAASPLLIPTSKAALGAAALGTAGGLAAGGAGKLAETQGWAPQGTGKVLGLLGSIGGGLYGGGIGALRGPQGIRETIRGAKSFVTGGPGKAELAKAEEMALRKLVMQESEAASRQALRKVSTEAIPRRLELAEKVAEARLKDLIARRSSSDKVNAAKLALQEARNDIAKALGQGRIAETARKTDIGKDIAQARLKQQTEQAMRSGERAERFGSARVSQGERRTQIAEARARKQGLLSEPAPKAGDLEGALKASLRSAPKAPAVPLAPVDEAQLISMARFLRRTKPSERSALNEWLKQQPPEVARRLKEILDSGVDSMATTF